MCIAPPLSVLNGYTVVMDAAPGPDTSDNNLQLMLVDNPVVTGIRESTVNINSNDTITIDVSEECLLYSYHYSFHYRDGILIM